MWHWTNVLLGATFLIATLTNAIPTCDPSPDPVHFGCRLETATGCDDRTAQLAISHRGTGVAIDIETETTLAARFGRLRPDSLHAAYYAKHPLEVVTLYSETQNGAGLYFRDNACSDRHARAWLGLMPVLDDGTNATANATEATALAFHILSDDAPALVITETGVGIAGEMSPQHALDIGVGEGVRTDYITLGRGNQSLQLSVDVDGCLTARVLSRNTSQILFCPGKAPQISQHQSNGNGGVPIGLVITIVVIASFLSAGACFLFALYCIKRKHPSAQTGNDENPFADTTRRY